MLLNTSENKQELQFVIFFFLNAKWILWKRRCTVKYEQIWVDEQMVIAQYIQHVKEVVSIGKKSKYSANQDFFENIIIA